MKRHHLLKVVLLLGTVLLPGTGAWGYRRPTATQMRVKASGTLQKVDPEVEARRWMRRVAPLPFDPKDYSAADWRIAIQSARMLQALPPIAVAKILGQNKFASLGRTRSDSTSAFLILRVMFELPEDASPHLRFTRLGWIGASSAEASNGTLNLAWPMTWNGGNPRLVSGYRGYEGAPYSPSEEYEYLRMKYPYRDLDTYFRTHPETGLVR